MNEIPLFHVDAFADRPFTGNPAAVCLLENARSDSWMQSVAGEMNLSETAFVYPEADRLRLRWMTPTVEVDLCGHATLATAHVIHELVREQTLPAWLAPYWQSGTIRFDSRSGMLTAEVTSSGITLDFPASATREKDLPGDLAEALGVSANKIRYFGETSFDYLVQLSTAKDVRQLSPNMTAVCRYPVRGIIVTAAGDSADHDFISRFFAPASGVNEDPVTGSAHCALAPYWARQFGRQTLFGYQASHRGGHVRMDLRGDRVRLCGQAVTILKGKLVNHEPRQAT